MPIALSEDQHRDWVRRWRTAENTLAIQALEGKAPKSETIAQFQRYVDGEITLARAIAQADADEEPAPPRSAFRQYLSHAT